MLFTLPRKTKEGFCGVRGGEEERREEEKEFPAKSKDQMGDG